MFSAYPFSTHPFLDTGRTLRGYIDFGLDLTAEFTLTIYVANSAGFASRPTDALPSQPFRGTLDTYQFHRSINGAGIGKFTTGSGNLVVNNTDAFYDFLPLSYTVDARKVVIRLARRNGSYNDATLVANVTATGWSVDTNQVAIDLIDYSYKLDVPVQPNVFLGTGGAEGTADLAGKRKPLILGIAFEVPAVPLVPSLLIYQVHDGYAQNIREVYDRGVVLNKGDDYASYAALVVATVASGDFATCHAFGMFKLGSSPAGTVTATVQGETTDGVLANWLSKTSDIVRWAIREKTSLIDPDDLDTDSFDALNTEQPAVVGYWLGPDDNLSVADFISNLMGGIGGWGGFRRDGLFEVRIFTAPSVSMSIDGSVHFNNDLDTFSGNLTTTQLNDYIIVCLTSNGGPILNVSSPALGTFTFLGTGGVSAGFPVEIWAAFSTGVLSDEIITVQQTLGDFCTVDAFAVSGSGQTSLVFDAGGPQTGVADPVSITTVDANSMVIAAFRMNSEPTPTAGSGFSAVSGADYQLVEYKTVPSGSTLSCTLGTGAGDSNGAIAIAIPRAGIVQSFTRNDIVGDDLRREPLPSAYRPPPWRWRVPYERAYTVTTDVAAAATEAHRAFIAEPFRLAEASDTDIKTDHPFAQDTDPVQAYFANYADALAEAERLLALFRSSRNIYRMTLPRRALVLNLGDVFELTYPRFDLAFGRLLTVIELSESVGDGLDTVEVVAYG